MRKSIAVLVLLLCASATWAGEPDKVRKSSKKIPDQYIVVFNDKLVEDVEAAAADLSFLHKGQKLHVYKKALKGFSIKLNEKRVRELANDPRVSYVEEDGEVTLSATQSPATWGIDRIDQRDLPLSNSYTYNYTGSGVKAYIIDTGILTTHTQFGGRAIHGRDTVNNDNDATDCNGHGTHVAGTVGGSTYGVAKNVTLVAVRVLDCNGSGTTSGVIAGIDWVTADHAAGAKAVANMSLGGGASSALDTAVNNSINDGISYSVAAGNDNLDACGGSPSRVAAAITVGSTTSTDARSSFSNWGTCLDIFAPGSSITSAWHTSTTATNTISGTSMATPHVAGVAALYLEQNGFQSAATVRDAIVNASTLNKVTSPGTGSPNRLLYSLLGAAPPPPPPPTGTNVLKNPGFESGAVDWTQTAGVIDSSTGRPARTGSWKAWLCGYGTTHTDYVYQNVTVPSSSTQVARLRFWIRIDSAETTTSIAYDKFNVQISTNGGSTYTTLATYSNLNKNATYVEKVFDLTSYEGLSVRLRLYATEDSSLQTSFVVDDTSLKLE